MYIFFLNKIGPDKSDQAIRPELQNATGGPQLLSKKVNLVNN